MIDRLASCTRVNIAVTITTDDTEIFSKVEPGTSSPNERWEILQALKNTRASTGFHFFPILPFFSDDEKTMENMVRKASEAEVDYMLSGMLYLSGGIKEKYFRFIKKEFPQFYTGYVKLYPRGRANADYKSRIHSFLGKMRKKYGVKTLSENHSFL